MSPSSSPSPVLSPQISLIPFVAPRILYCMLLSCYCEPYYLLLMAYICGYGIVSWIIMSEDGNECSVMSEWACGSQRTNRGKCHVVEFFWRSGTAKRGWNSSISLPLFDGVLEGCFVGSKGTERRFRVVYPYSSGVIGLKYFSNIILLLPSRILSAACLVSHFLVCYLRFS